MKSFSKVLKLDANERPKLNQSLASKIVLKQLVKQSRPQNALLCNVWTLNVDIQQSNKRVSRKRKDPKTCLLCNVESVDSDNAEVRRAPVHKVCIINCEIDSIHLNQIRWIKCVAKCFLVNIDFKADYLAKVWSSDFPTFDQAVWWKICERLKSWKFIIWERNGSSLKVVELNRFP